MISLTDTVENLSQRQPEHPYNFKDASVWQ